MSLDVFLIIVVPLAAYRLTRFITADDIPFGPIRDRLEQRWEGSIFLNGLTCSFCMGAWISFALVFALAQLISIPLPALYALAVSSIVGIIGRYVD